MKLQHWAAFLVLGLSVGCQSPSPTPANPPAATSEQIERIRQSFKEKDAGVQVGVVLDVLPASNLAAVVDVDLSSVKNGDVVCFIDSTSAPLVCGKVVQMANSQIHVEYEKLSPGHRAPVRGDLAVIFR